MICWNLSLVIQKQLPQAVGSGGEKRMDKLMNNHWFIRIMALLFALLLYASVNIESPTSNNKPGSSFFPAATATDSATLTEIPVKVYYDENKFVVRGIPQTVTVTLEGPTSILTKTKQVKDFEIYIDLRNYPVGTHRVQLKQKNISDQLEVNIYPSVVTVSIHEKVTEDFPVEVDFINKNKMKEGYSIEEAIVQPNTVKITGAREDIDSIALVKARVNLENVSETLKQESNVAVYDKNGNILPVEIEPSVVTITVPVISPSKSIPIQVKKEGKLPEGLSISNISVVPNVVTVYGSEEILNQLDVIDGVSVDLSKIKGDTTLEVEIPKQEGITKISPEKVQIKIEVDKQEEVSFKDLPIKAVGLNDNQTITFIDPETAKLDVQVKGTENALKNLKGSDFELFVNVADVGTGKHQVKVQVNGPQNITWTLSKEEVTVQISPNDIVEEEIDQDQTLPSS
jgi:YbbR domain-containing protein